MVPAERKEDSEDSLGTSSGFAEQNLYCCARHFRKPTGLDDGQVVRIRIRPESCVTTLFLNDENLEVVRMDGLANATITDMMLNSNRIELRWSHDSLDPENSRPRLPEHFEAWLEISEAAAG